MDITYQTFVLQVAAQVGCVKVMHGDQGIHRHVPTVMFVVYLEQILELWDPQVYQADTVDVNVNQVTGE
jgi:hypothetical protein